MGVWGWKTLAGIGLIVVGGGLSAYGYTDAGNAIKTLGEALAGIGVVHKFVKSGRG